MAAQNLMGTWQGTPPGTLRGERVARDGPSEGNHPFLSTCIFSLCPPTCLLCKAVLHASLYPGEKMGSVGWNAFSKVIQQGKENLALKLAHPDKSLCFFRCSTDYNTEKQWAQIWFSTCSVAWKPSRGWTESSASCGRQFGLWVPS